MKNYKSILALAFFFCFMLFSNNINATHVVGGDLTYKCLGNSRYEVTLEFRRDCFNGASNAQFDDPAAIAIFDQNGFLVEILGQGGMMFIPFAADDTLNEIVTSECNVIGGDVCTQTTTYRDTVILPFRTGGYFLSYQRCCRNATLNNIVDPLNTGATYWVRLTEKAINECNSTPVFNDWPVSFICVDDTLMFDHSATDIDGDSLVYELCAPSTGATRMFPKPVPPASPPYGIVDYNFGFSANRPLGTNVPMEINAQTGQLFAVPDKVGQFLIGICVREFRDGELLSEVKRDFEFNVRVCGRTPEVMFETNPLNFTTKCDGLDIELVNTTTSNFLPADSLDYTWYFDYPFNTLVSTEMSPSFTYPEPGLYTIALIGDDGTCQDTFFYQIGVSTPNDPLVNFELESSNCEGSVEVYLRDLTTSSQDILDRIWIIAANGNIDTLYGETPTIEIFQDQTISVRLDIITESGCNGTLTRLEDILSNEFNNVFTDQIICDNVETVIFTNTNSDAVVSIQPSNNILVDGNNYTLFGFTGAEDFIVTVSDTFCFEQDTISIETFEEPDLNLQEIIQCGTDSVELNPNGSANYFYEWSVVSGILGFDPNEVNPVVSLNQTTLFNVTVYTSEGSNCFSEDSINVIVSPYPEFDFLPSANIITCLDSTLTISVTTNNDVVWTNDANIQLGTGPELTINQVNQNAVLTATVTNPFGCVTSKDVRINISSEPDFSFTADSDMIVCMGHSASLEIISSDSIVWESLNGDILGIGTTITIDNITEPMPVIVTAYNQFGCPGSQQIVINVYDDPTYTLADSTQLDVCFGSSTMVEAISADSIFWTDLDGNIISTESIVGVEDIQLNPMIIINVINEFDCLVSDTLSFNTLELPMPDLDPISNFVVCRGSDNTININSIDSVTWLTLDEEIVTTGNELTLLNALNDTSYQVSFVTAAGCEIRDTFTVTVQSDINLDIMNGLNEINYCEGELVSISASSESEATVEWYENNILIGTGNLLEFNPQGNTSVTAIATDSLACTDQDMILITESIVEGTLVTPFSMCLGDSISLEFISDDPDAVDQIIWSPDTLIVGGGFIVQSSPTTDTEFSVLVIDTVGCSTEFTAEVLVGGFADDLNATADPDEILLSESSQLSVDFNPNYEYEWSPSESLDDPLISDPIATPSETTTYTVTVTDDLGCTGTDQLTVVVIQPDCDETDIFVPNLFTPNGDFLNDRFRVESNFIESMRLVIYNRWGQEIFVSEDQDVEWDGTFEGEQLAPDVFGYHVQIVCINGLEYTSQGSITLMK